MAKPTPGPWKVEENYGRLWISAGKGKKKIQIADVSDIETGVGSGEVDTDVRTTKANARLLAAVPDLLAGWESLLEALRGVQTVDPAQIIATLDGMIAQAR